MIIFRCHFLNAPNFMFCVDIEPFFVFSEFPQAFGVSLKNVCMFVVFVPFCAQVH